MHHQLRDSVGVFAKVRMERCVVIWLGDLLKAVGRDYIMKNNLT